MVDYSSQNKPNSLSTNPIIFQTLSNMDDSYSDGPHKPNQTSQTNTYRILPRKNSEQILKTIQNKVYTGSNNINNGSCKQQVRESNSKMQLLQIPTSDLQSNNLQDSSLYDEGDYGTSKMSSTNLGGIKKISSTEKEKQQKRTSISTYQKRVVELNLNSQENIKQSSGEHSMKDLLRKKPIQMKGSQKSPNQSYTTKSINSFQVPISSVDISKLKDIHKMVANCMNSQDQSLDDYCSEIKQKQTHTKRNPISLHTSPKDLQLSSNFFSSPRLSSGLISARNKNKQKNALQSYQKGYIQPRTTLTQIQGNTVLNRSEQQLLFGSSSQKVCGLSYQNKNSKNLGNQTLTNESRQLKLSNFRSNSPQLKKPINNQYSNSKDQSYNNTSLKKIQSTSNLKLLQNLSLEGRLSCQNNQKLLRISPSSKNIVSHKLNEFFGKKNDHFQQKQSESQRFYSPTATISINKALSRISSVNEFRNIKEQVELHRKSTENSHGISMNKQIKNRKTECFGQPMSQRSNKQLNVLSEYDERFTINCGENTDGDEDQDYLTMQEKLWNAIETKQPIELIKQILDKEECGEIEVNAKNVFEDGWTCLHYAVHEGYFEVVQMLIELYHASVDSRTVYNKTPFHFACRRGEEQIIRYLLGKGANPAVVDRDGCTPLHYLCECENLEMIQLILPLSPGSKDVRNRFGKKPADLLSNNGLKKIIRQFNSRRHDSTSTSQSKNRNSKSRTSVSREKVNGYSSNIQIHKIQDNVSGIESINQLFSKFKHYKQQSIDKKAGYDLNQTENGKNKYDQTASTDKEILSQKSSSIAYSNPQLKEKNRPLKQLSSNKGPNKRQTTVQEASSKYISNKPQVSGRMSHSNFALGSPQSEKTLETLSQQSTYQQKQQICLISKGIPQSCKNINTSSVPNKSKIMFTLTQNTNVGNVQQVMSNQTSPNGKKVFSYTTQKPFNKQPQKVLSNQNSSSKNKKDHYNQMNSTQSVKDLQILHNNTLSQTQSQSNLLHATSQNPKANENKNLRIQNLSKQIDQVIKQKTKEYKSQRKLAIQLEDDLDMVDSYQYQPTTTTSQYIKHPISLKSATNQSYQRTQSQQQLLKVKQIQIQMPEDTKSKMQQQENEQLRKVKDLNKSKQQENNGKVIRSENQLFSSENTGESSINASELPQNKQPQENIMTTQNEMNSSSKQNMKDYDVDKEQSNILKETYADKQKDQSTPNDLEQQKVGPWSFIAHQLLGTGSFGEVYLVEKISSGQYYAMKVLAKAKIMGHNLTRYALTERNVLSIQKHPFIVGLHYAFQTQEKLFLVLDYCPGGDLAEYLQLEKKFNEDKTRLYACDILLALEELHRKDIIFRDLKPDNVVLDKEGHALLTDFGLSKEGVMREGMAKSFCGSYAYLAPEMLKKIGHGKAVDWYLLGVIIYEMLCGLPPYYANNKEELFENIKNQHLIIPSHISIHARDLITKLLNRNSRKRLGTFGGAEEIKKHPFFKGIDWEKALRREYKAPEPYLTKRFENFLAMSPQMRTNADVYEQLRVQAIQKAQFKGKDDQHLQGWSFVSPSKQYE